MPRYVIFPARLSGNLETATVVRVDNEVMAQIEARSRAQRWGEDVFLAELTLVDLIAPRRPNPDVPVKAESPKATFVSFPTTGLLRLKQIIGCRKSKIPAIIPLSASAWYAGVKTGVFPKSLKMGRATVWRAEDIHALLATLGK